MCFAWENHLQLDENFKDLGEFPSGESILKESKGKFEFEMSFWILSIVRQENWDSWLFQCWPLIYLPSH